MNKLLKKLPYTSMTVRRSDSWRPRTAQ